MDDNYAKLMSDDSFINECSWVESISKQESSSYKTVSVYSEIPVARKVTIAKTIFSVGVENALLHIYTNGITSFPTEDEEKARFHHFDKLQL